MSGDGSGLGSWGKGVARNRCGSACALREEVDVLAITQGREGFRFALSTLQNYKTALNVK